jgi:hypothetical protein
MDQDQRRTGARAAEAHPVPVQDDLLHAGDIRGPRHRICIPEIAREITSRWISEVPSKIV